MTKVNQFCLLSQLPRSYLFVPYFILPHFFRSFKGKIWSVNFFLFFIAITFLSFFVYFLLCVNRKTSVLNKKGKTLSLINFVLFLFYYFFFIIFFYFNSKEFLSRTITIRSFRTREAKCKEFCWVWSQCQSEILQLLNEIRRHCIKICGRGRIWKMHKIIVSCMK